MTVATAPEYTIERRDDREFVSFNAIAGDAVLVSTESYPRERAQHPARVEFEVERLDFNALTERLVASERTLGRSSAELMREYHNSGHDVPEEMRAWADAFFLYLGTREIRRYSCP